MTLPSGNVILEDYPNPGFPNAMREEFKQEVARDLAVAMQVEEARCKIMNVTGLPATIEKDPNHPNHGEKQQLVIDWQLAASHDPAAPSVDMQM